MKTIKLADWCEKTGVKYLTAWRWFKADKMPVYAYQTESGTILVEEEEDSVVLPDNNNVDAALSLFLKKSLEYSNNNSSIEDFAAYILSNFQLKLNGSETPKYSRNKPKPEEVQKHFKKFLPANVEKPAPCAFIPEPEVWENIAKNSDTLVGTNETESSAQGLVNQIRASDAGALVMANSSLSQEDLQTLSSLIGSEGTSFGSLQSATGDTISYADVNPQNYTYSTNCVSSSSISSLNESPVFLNLYNALHTPGPGLNTKPKRGRPRKKI